MVGLAVSLRCFGSNIGNESGQLTPLESSIRTISPTDYSQRDNNHFDYPARRSPQYSENKAQPSSFSPFRLLMPMWALLRTASSIGAELFQRITALQRPRARPKSHYAGAVARVLITGGAGFIGSHTIQKLADSGLEVIALDNFNHYYSPDLKRDNAKIVDTSTGVKVLDLDLNECNLDRVLDGVRTVIHLAGQPGVRPSWDSFHSYVRENISATERLLRASHRAGIDRFVYASSSSVYGNSVKNPVDERSLPEPFSPYGVSKLAGEQLVRAYSENFGFRSVCLRYFTVYGPRQRPDMAIERLIRSALTDEPFVINGDGSQSRNFTFVNDVATANLLATEVALISNEVFNITSEVGSTLNEVISTIEGLMNKKIVVVQSPSTSGDVSITAGSSRHAQEILGWRINRRLVDGLVEQIEYSVRG